MASTASVIIHCLPSDVDKRTFLSVRFVVGCPGETWLFSCFTGLACRLEGCGLFPPFYTEKRKTNTTITDISIHFLSIYVSTLFMVKTGVAIKDSIEKSTLIYLSPSHNYSVCIQRIVQSTLSKTDAFGTGTKCPS